MSLDERLFGWLHRTLKRRGPALEENDEAVHLAELETRLTFVACAIGEASFEVQEAEAAGGVRGHTLLLPKSIGRYAARAENAAAYGYRVAFGTFSARLGFSLAGVADTPEAKAAATLLAIPATRAALRRDVPGAATLLARLRPPDQNRRTGLAAEVVRLVSYGQAPVDVGELPAPASVLGPLATLLTRPPEKQSELTTAVPRLLALEGLSGSALVDAVEAEAVVFGQLYAAGGGDGGGGPSTEAAPPQRIRGSERKAAAVDEVEVVDAHSPEDDNPLVHSFEKVHTADEYDGGSKRIDGDDHLEEQLEALEELDLRTVIRTQQAADSMLRADGLFGAFEVATDPEASLPGVPYDEWDGRRRAYRRAWCSVHVDQPPRQAQGARLRERRQRLRHAHAREIRQLRAQLEAVQAEHRWVNRQRDGEEVDLNLYVDREVTRRMGGTPEERVYLARRRKHRELSTLVLLDVSLSSDAYVKNQRMLDVAQDALLVLGDVFDGCQDEFAVAGFSSNTRHRCRFTPLKGFDESWATGAGRLLSLTPRGYTRIGPALRHGSHLLQQRPAQRRVLLVVTDGRPTDYDRYEGRHGIDDVRQAFREAYAAGLTPFALVISATCEPSFVRLFGAGQFAVLSSPTALPMALADLYTKASGHRA